LTPEHRWEASNSHRSYLGNNRDLYILVVMATMSKYLLIGLALASYVSASEVHLDCHGFVSAALSNDPQMLEDANSSEAKRLKVGSIKADVVLPKFEITAAFGPAPGLKTGVDSYGDTINVWDFTKMGPYFGTEIKVAQPLNIGQLELALKTARADFTQKQWEIAGKRVNKVSEYQQYYYGYLLAWELTRLTDDAVKQMQKAEDRLQEKLDAQEDADDDESDTAKGKVSQDDLLQIKAGRFEVDKASLEAQNGLQKAKLAIQFTLNLGDSDVFVPADSFLVERSEVIPRLDSLKAVLRNSHPDLLRIKSGLEALDGQMRMEDAKLGPQFFLFGSFKYAKSWAGDRRTLSEDAFVKDPVNTLTGSFGVGIKYNVNFWSAVEKSRIARAELRQLKFKDAYAADGLEMKLDLQYQEWQSAKARLESARKSLRATEALMKGAAMRFDVDPSEGSKLIDAYRRNLLMQKDYYFSVYQYNVAVADLIAKAGMVLDDVSRSSP